MKKFLKFGALVLVVGIISFTASVFLSKTKDSSEQAGATGVDQKFTDTTTEYHPLAKGSTKVNNEDASFPFFIPDQQEIRYYNSRSGEIKSMKLSSSNAISLVATIKPHALAMTWSPDGTQIIATYAGERIYTNLKTNTNKTISTNITSPRFARSSDNVAYVYFNGTTNEGNISIADSQFKEFKNIIKTRLKTWEIQWTDERRLSLIATSASTKLNSLFITDTTKGGLEALVENQKYLETTWAPDGNQLVFSRLTRSGLELFYLNASDRSAVALGVAGRAGKCAWSADSATLYCAIPSKPLTGDSSAGSEDSFVQIKTGTSSRKPETLYTAADASFVDARDVMYSTVQNTLFFRNFKDGRLYALPLPK